MFSTKFKFKITKIKLEGLGDSCYKVYQQHSFLGIIKWWGEPNPPQPSELFSYPDHAVNWIVDNFDRNKIDIIKFVV